MKNKIKVLIPNATSPRNIGDLAMLEVLLSYFPSKKYDVIVHSVDPHLYKDKKVIYKKTIYDWSVLSQKKPTVRLLRLSQVIIKTLLFNKVNFKNNNQINSLFRDYKEADLIAFVGGGYLRTSFGFTQSLNYLMNLLPFYLATKTKSKTVVCPISFGPFRYFWHEKLGSYILGKLDIVSVRENISKNILKRNGLVKVLKMSDHALLLSNNRKTKRSSKLTVGFTIRNWGGKTEQLNLLTSVERALTGIAKEINCNILPIIQVDAGKYGEKDEQLTKEVYKGLKRNKVNVLPIVKNTTLKEAERTYKSIDMLLGMRMHSNILSAIQGTPYVAIAYEYKTKGIGKYLGMSKYTVESNEVSFEQLYSTLLEVFKNRNKISDMLFKNINTIHEKEKNIWSRYLSI